MQFPYHNVLMIKTPSIVMETSATSSESVYKHQLGGPRPENLILPGFVTVSRSSFSPVLPLQLISVSWFLLWLWPSLSPIPVFLIMQVLDEQLHRLISSLLFILQVNVEGSQKEVK